MGRWYYLGPWILATSPKGGSWWEPPPGTVGLVDLRALDGSGVGFFATDAPLADPDYTAFGDGATTLDAIPVTAAERADWAARVDLDVVPASSTLLDLLWDTLTVHSDADGAMHAKPIMPTSRGILELHLGGHSLVRSRRLPADVTATPHWPKMQRVLQNDYLAVEAEAGRGQSAKARALHRRWLGYQARKYGLGAEVSDLLIPAGRPKVTPLPPETTITDNFNRTASNPPSASGEGWSWTEVTGTAWATTGTVLEDGSEHFDYHALRAESDLSGADHYCQLKVAAIGTSDYDIHPRFGPCVRFAGAATTFYFGGLIRDSASTYSSAITKSVAGTETNLTTGTWGGSVNDVAYLEVDGSSLVLKVNGSTVASVTDTAISGGTRTGVAALYQSGWTVDDFEAADLGGGTSAIAGSSAGTSTCSGTLTGLGAVAGSSAGAATTAGTLVGDGALAGAAAGVATTAGVLGGAGALEGAAAGVAATTGQLVGAGALAGASAGAASASGTLVGSGALAGASAGGATVTGDLHGLAPISGAAAGVASAQGVLSGAGALTGTSSGSSTTVGVLLGAGAIAGSAAGTSTATLDNASVAIRWAFAERLVSGSVGSVRRVATGSVGSLDRLGSGSIAAVRRTTP